ncbi:MAG TPA: hypothetical protein VEY91_09460 [Candidatus Limnocylindria bacterium]|nr:hypothetical protein [Candidatus Limnocylindria bacterium]
MDDRLVTGLIAVLAVAAGALLLRRFASRGETVSYPSEGVDPATETPEAFGSESEDFEDSTEAVAITSDGWAFVPDGREVQLVPPGEPEDLIPSRATVNTGYGPQTDPDIQVLGGRGAPVNPHTGRSLPGWKPGEHLRAGDLVAARVRRGAPGVDPWRLEALGRDHEYRHWPFETEEAAQAALAVIEPRIVRPPHDPDGEPQAIGEADFAHAREDYEATEAELAMAPDEEEPGTP